MRGEELCFWHDPDHADEAEQARRLGGQRRRREKITEGAYDLEGLDTVAGIRRLLHLTILDTLGLENSVSRSRALFAGGPGGDEAFGRWRARGAPRGDRGGAWSTRCGTRV
jgi:hypothetical protein